MMSRSSWPGHVVPAVMLAATLGGCVVGPDFHAPPPPPGTHYAPGGDPAATVSAGGPGGSAQQFESSPDLTSEWWRLFRSDALDRTVQAALDNSSTLAEAAAKLRRAQEEAAALASATRYPVADAKLSAARQQVDPAALGFPRAQAPGPFNVFGASISVAYTFDLFGGNRRALEALEAETDLRFYELHGARRTLAAGVVTTALRQATLHAEMQLNGELLALQRGVLAITSERERAGGVSAVDVARQRAVVRQAEAKLPPLQRQLAQTDHLLTVYTGRMPAEVTPAAFTLENLALPASIPLTVPSTLVRQRPDVRAAEALWRRASAEVGVATANRFPRFTLAGSFGTQRTQVEDIANGINVWSIGLNLLQPVLRSGELAARQRAALAAYDAAAAFYRQTVLQALREVADGLRAVEADALALRAQSAATDEAQATVRVVDLQLAAGGVSRLALLDAQRQLLEMRIERVKAQADRYLDTAALLHALGGGWD